MTRLNKNMDPIFLAYGRACYTAQNLESTIRTFLVVLRSKKGKNAFSPKAILEIEDETYRKAVGDLFDRAKGSEYFTSEEIKLVKHAIKTRNHLMHGFWDENINLLLSPEGIEEIVAKLENHLSIIKRGDEVVVARIDHYLVEYGLSTEICKAVAQQKAEFSTFDDQIVKH